MRKDRNVAYLVLLATAIIWGIATPVIKYTLGFISPFSFLFYRFALASLLVIIPLYLRFKKIKPLKKDYLKYLLLAFLSTSLNLILLFLGIQKTTAIDASIIAIISPVLIILGGAFFLKETITSREKTGIILILGGTFLAIIQPILGVKENPFINLIGNLLVLSSVFSWVAFTLLAKKNKRLDPFLLTGFSYLLGLICVFPFFLAEKTPLSPQALPGIIYMAVFSSILAYFFYLFGLSKIEASEATIFDYLKPLFSIPIAIIFLKEKITPFFLFGALLIILGVFICESRPKLGR